MLPPAAHSPPPLGQQAAQQQPLVSSSSRGSVARTKQLSNSCACFPELSSAPRMRNSICPSVPSTANSSSSLVLALCKTPPSRGELPRFTLGLEVSYMRNKSKTTYSLFSLGIIILYHYQVSAFPFSSLQAKSGKAVKGLGPLSAQPRGRWCVTHLHLWLRSGSPQQYRLKQHHQSLAQ